MTAGTEAGAKAAGPVIWATAGALDAARPSAAALLTFTESGRGSGKGSEPLEVAEMARQHGERQSQMYCSFLQFGIDDWFRAHPVLLGLSASAVFFIIGYQSKDRSLGALAFQIMALLTLLGTAADAIHSRMVLATIVLLLAFVIEVWLMRRRSSAERST